MNLGKLTNIVLGAIKSRKDKTNKITQLAMAINGTYVEDTAYVDDRILWVFGKSEDEFSVQYSNISKIVEKMNSLKSGEAGLFLTEKLASKFSILAGLTGVQIIDLSQKEAYDMYGPHFAALGVDITGVVLAVDFTIGELDNNTKFTYNGVEYTLLPADEEPTVTAPEEEPEAPTLYSAVFNTKTGVTTSEYTLGDNLVASNENDGTSLSPALLLLTSELAQNMSVSVTTTGNSSSSISPEMILNFVDSMSVKELTNFADVDVSSISSFISEHNITHVVSFMNVYDAFAPSLQGTSDEIISSFTITYNGNPYVYGFDNFTFNMGQ